MKKIICSVCIAMIVSLIGGYGKAEAGKQEESRYFSEFLVPLPVVADKMYQRTQFIQFAEYVAYNSPFNIMPNEILLLFQHEYPMLDYYVLRGRFR